MTMALPDGPSYVEIERYSKLGTLQGHLNAYKTSQSLSTQGYIQRACAFNLGAMQISLHRYDEGLEFLEKALPPEGKRDGRSNGDLYFNFGLAHEGLKDTSEAKKYYEMALEEYKSERTRNVEMEATTIHKIGRLHLEEKDLLKADNYLLQLIEFFSDLGQFEKEIQAKIERASIHLSMRKASEAQEIADACIEALNEAKPCLSAAKHYTDLAVIYTQLILYEKAINASRKALQIMEGQSTLNSQNTKLLSVLYQNLGAIYNFKEEYDLSIEYHSKATQGFAKIKERLFQGHCFTNMGYAYSQLKNMEKAKEYFLHGLQAAREEDDHKSQWQNLEALACVAFHVDNPQKAEEYLKEAMSIFPKSREAKDGIDLTTWDRLNKKYRTSIEIQTKKTSITQSTSRKHLPGAGREGDLYSDQEQGKIKVIRRGSQVKYLKVRRSGTLQRFNKVALGLDPRTSIHEVVEESGKSSSGSDSESSGSESEESDDDEEVKTKHAPDEEDKRKLQRGEGKEEKTESKRPVNTRPPDSYLPPSVAAHAVVSDMESGVSEEVVKVDENSCSDSDEDSKFVKAEMRHYLSLDVLREKQRNLQADVHAQAEESDDESDDDSDDGSSDEDVIDGRDRPNKPPVPSLSPQTTDKKLNTYETVGFGHATPSRIESSRTPSKNLKPDEGEAKLKFSRRPSDLDGMNFFHDDDDDIMDYGEKNSKVDGSSGIYESIRTSTSKSKNRVEKDTNDSDGNEIVTEEETEKLSRAQRDVVLYDQFKLDLREKDKDGNQKDSNRNDSQEDINMEDQKKSKSCILM